jgi:hypothetical protein
MKCGGVINMQVIKYLDDLSMDYPLITAILAVIGIGLIPIVIILIVAYFEKG